MMKMTVIGTIGKGPFAPTCKIYFAKDSEGNKIKNEKGEFVKKKTFQFTMFADDLSKMPEFDKKTGKPIKTRELVTVIMFGGQKNEKIFSLLRPGRTVQVSGNFFTNPRSVKDKDGKERIYTNNTIYSSDIHFMDSIMSKQLERIEALAKAAGLEAEQINAFVQPIKKYLDDMDAKEPTHVIDDQTIDKKTPNTPTPDPVYSDDPDVFDV